VNTAGIAMPVNVQISGARKVDAKGEAVVLAAKAINDTNSIEQPGKVVPRTEKVSGLGDNFTRELPPFSITVLKVMAK
jgi:alpha-L-arabinofuranosidase